jgi:hypothetical protein
MTITFERQLIADSREAGLQKKAKYWRMDNGLTIDIAA